MPEDLVYPHEEAETTLVNITNSDPQEMDFYIGESHEAYNLEESPLRNPFEKSEKGREKAVEHYKMYLYRRYLEEEEFRKFLHKLEGKTLGCLCYPKRCHGEVIVDLLNKHDEDGIEGSIELMEERLNGIEADRLGRKGFREYETAIEALEDVRQKFDI